MTALTIYKNIYDNKTDKRINFEDFGHFSRFLFEASKAVYESKSDASLMTPAVYAEGSTRANNNVLCWAGWAALDVDDHDLVGDIKTELNTRWGDYEYICYSTASSTKGKPKFRIVFPLEYDINNDKIKHFWYALNRELGDLGDVQTKDLSRMYYVPGTYAGADNFIFSNSGKSINPQVLMDKHEFVVKTGNSFMDSLPESMRLQIMAHRKSEMTNTDVRWSNYRDCPFVNKRLVQEYGMISETGWYHKMYQIMISIAGNALKKKYPISAREVSSLCKQIDMDNGGWYNDRPLEKEATGAIEYVYGQI
jgi:hypothetical protein